MTPVFEYIPASGRIARQTSLPFLVAFYHPGDDVVRAGHLKAWIARRQRERGKKEQ
jgi:hypothetical protein